MKTIRNKIIETLKELEKFVPRIWENDERTANFIISFFKSKGIEPYVHRFKVKYPIYRKCTLYIGNISLNCLPSGFSSGTIEGNFTLIDSVRVLLEELEVNEPNLNYNSKSNWISTPVFFKQPSISISRKDLETVKNNIDNVKGELKVSFKTFNSYLILVGNTSSPKKIVLTHYDSLWGGAIDNGLAVSILMNIVEKLSKKDILVVFSGAEELSNEYPIYWGYGYRIFEKKFYDFMEKAKKLIVIDSIGHTKFKRIKDHFLIKEAFPIKNKDFLNKTTLISGDYYKLLPFYHSKGDNIERVKYIEVKRLVKEISKKL